MCVSSFFYFCCLSFFSSFLDKPLKKRKQDSFPLEPGAGGPGGPTGAPGSGSTGGGNAGKLTPQEATAAGNGASRPPLMVSIDLQQAGRADGQLDPCLAAPIPALEAQRWPEEPASGPAALEGSDTALHLKPDGRPEVIKNRVDKHDRREGRESSKHRHDDNKPDRREEIPKPSNRGEHGRDRDRESDRDRRHRSEAVVKERRSPGRSDRDRPGFRSASEGEPGRSSSRQDGSKPASSTSGPKLPDSFPAHLLGGHSGALKNFQIPKVIWAAQIKFPPTYQSFSSHCLQSHNVRSHCSLLIVFLFYHLNAFVGFSGTLTPLTANLCTSKVQWCVTILDVLNGTYCE